MNENKLVAIQLLRATAGISVVLAHLSVSYQIIFDRKDVVWNFFLGNFGVDLFFVISGFIMLYSSERLFASPRGRELFLKKRFARIVPLYWIATTFAVALAPISYLTWQTILGSYAFLPLPTPQGGPLLIVGWTLNIEMFFYLIFSISIPYGRLASAIVTTAILAPLSILGQYFYADRSIFIAGFTNPLMLEFLFGIWIALFYRRKPRISRPLSISLIFVAIVIMFFADKSGAQNVTRALEWGIACSGLIVATTFVDLNQRSRFWTPLILIGDSTYAIYLLHWYVLMSPPAILTRLLSPIFHPALYSVMIVLMAVGIGVLAHLFVEKPLVAYLNRWTRLPRRVASP